ncbi:MAG: amidohydrolase family protein [Alphaproteobacteria bacterium]|nr:amidohydrolase family protein [Alphaproteobacteria bacterium]
MGKGQSAVTVVRGGTIWTGGARPNVIRGADLVIEDGRVAAIEAHYRGRADLEIDAGDCLLVPGLINAHVHPGNSPRSRGLAEDIDLPDDGAFYHLTLPVQLYARNVLSQDDVAAIMEWDLVAMLAGGATTIVAEQFGPWANWIKLIERIGFRCHYGYTYPNDLGAIGYVGKDGKIVSDAAVNVAAGLTENLGLHDRYHGAFEDRLRIHLSPHGPDTVPEDLLVETKRHCRERGIHAHLHLAQHMSERKVVSSRSKGRTSVEYLDHIGFLGPDVMATHVTYVERDDIAILARTKTNVVHASYRKAKEGIASPFWDFLAGGVNVAIATDSFSHDLIQDLKLAAMIGKIRGGRVGHPNAREVLTCATHGAAKALGRGDLGHLEPGARGDVTIINLTSPFNAPVLDPLRALVYYSGAADIRCTLVDGKLLYDRGRIVGSDVTAIRKQASEACHRLWQAASEGGAMPKETSYGGH